MMKDLEKFKEIFEGLDCAYGQTVKTDQFSEKGKHKTKSFTITKYAAAMLKGRPGNEKVLFAESVMFELSFAIENRL